MSVAKSSIAGQLAVILATGLGVGRFPWAPGTIGTLWGIPLAWSILSLPNPAWQLVAIVALFILGVPICDRAARQLGVKDPGCIVWDEFAALPIVFLGLAPEAMRRPSTVVIGFALFRLFDITKLPPIRQLEQLPGGWGIMADDVAAAVYASIAFFVIRSLTTIALSLPV